METNIITDRLNYLNESIPFYIGHIYEYDIKHAYPSLLKNTNFKFTNPELIEILNDLDKPYDKKSLLIMIGKEIKINPELSNYINDRLKSIIKEFQIINNLTKDNVISIKKDALFVNHYCKNLILSDVEFIEKNKYNLYFYDYNSKYEFYINKFLNTMNYSIKGLGNTFDKNLYDIICNLVYISLSNNDLSYIKMVENLFMNKNIEKLLPYLPSELVYKDMIYIDKNELYEKDLITIDHIKDTYNKYYSNIFKSLINYLL